MKEEIVVSILIKGLSEGCATEIADYLDSKDLDYTIGTSKLKDYLKECEEE